MIFLLGSYYRIMLYYKNNIYNHVLQVVLSNQIFIEKATDYDYLKPWLGTGLLTSAGKIFKSKI